MKRINLFISEDYFEFLKSRKGTLSEHIRFAIAEYVHKLRQEEVRLARSASASQSIKEVKDGTTNN